jgi:hypothetical protein
MGGSLHRHVDGIVGVADAGILVVATGNRVGTGGQHGVDRIPAPAEQAGLRAVAIERNAEREHLAGADQARGPHNVLSRNVIERADLIVVAPPAPIAELLGRFGDGLPADGNVHCMYPFSFSIAHSAKCELNPGDFRLFCLSATRGARPLSKRRPLGSFEVKNFSGLVRRRDLQPKTLQNLTCLSDLLGI